LVVLALGWVWAGVPSLLAQSPTISSLSPLGVRPGTAQDVVVRGGNLAGASDFWTSFPAHASLTPQKANNGKNPGEVSFRLNVPAETPPGIYAARAATDRGISPLKMLLVDDLPVALRQPGNTAPSTPQMVSIPAAVDGAIEPLARHYYKFHVEAGQRLAIEVFARRIGSLMDPTLRLLNADGREITYSDDLPGLSEDGAIDHTFAKAGDCLVEVGENLNQGGNDYSYRLRIGDFPVAVVPLPLAAKRGEIALFQFADNSGSDIEPLQIKMPIDPQLRAWNVPVRFHAGATRSFASVMLSDHKQFIETEPNNDAKAANRVEFGTDLNGRLQKPGDVDRFVIAAKAGQSLRFKSITHRLGSPADVVLRLTNSAGGQIGYADGTGTNEAALTATFPADGDYYLEVRDLNHRGGLRFGYHVEASPVENGFSLAAASDALNVPTGGTVAVVVSAQRSGFGGPISVRAVDLPPGVVSVPTVIGPGEDHAVLSLRSTGNATAGRVYPIRIVGSARVDNRDFQASAGISDELRTEMAGMPYPPLALTEALALGIEPHPSFTLRTEPAEIVFGRNLSATVKVIAERQKGFDEEIALAVVTPETAAKKAKQPLPAGIAAALKPIPKGASSVDITFSGETRAALGDFTAVLVGTLKKGNATITQPAPGIGLKLEPPFELSVQPVVGKISRKGILKLRVAARRNPAFKGEIAVRLSYLPKGVAAAPAKISAGSSNLELPLTAAPDAATGPSKNIAVRGEAKVGAGTYSGKALVTELTVQ